MVMVWVWCIEWFLVYAVGNVQRQEQRYDEARQEGEEASEKDRPRPVQLAKEEEEEERAEEEAERKQIYLDLAACGASPYVSSS